MDTPGRIAELERKFAENPRRYFAALANEYRKNGELERAIELCERHLAEQRNHLSGHVVLAQALVSAGRSDSAWEPLHIALDLDPENFIALRLLGELCAAAGDVEQARAYFFRALEIEPRSEEVTAGLKSLKQLSVEPVPATDAIPDHGRERLPAGLPALLDEPVADTAEAAEAAAEPVADAPPETTAEEELTPVETVDEVAAARESEPSAAAPDLSAAAERSPEPWDSWEFGTWPGETATPEEAARQPIESLEEEPAAEEFAEPETRPTLASETMVELYLQQGHTDLALGALRELVAVRPGDERIQSRLEELERQAAEKPKETVRDLFARLGRARKQDTPTEAAEALADAFAAAHEASPIARLFGERGGQDGEDADGAPFAAVLAAEPAPEPDDAGAFERWLEQIGAR